MHDNGKFEKQPHIVVSEKGIQGARTKTCNI